MSTLIKDQIFNSIQDLTNGDVITAFGPQCTSIRNCIIDLRKVSNTYQDEAISGVNGAVVDLFNCLILGSIKALLCGNGDYPEVDKKYAKWNIDGCVLIDCGRRCPEAQHGTKIEMTNTWIHNWGKKENFDVRCFGSWAHSGGRIRAKKCLFTQTSFFTPGYLNTFKDLIGHFGQAWNDKPSKLRDYFLPGVCRGLTAAKDGTVFASNCFKYPDWVLLENCATYMNYYQACQTISEIQENLHPEYKSFLNGLTLKEYFELEVPAN